MIQRAAVASALLVAGCPLAPSGSAEAPIFGGAETTAHPEVGWVAFDEEFLCSAVLVTARRALTAAHCVYAFEGDPAVLSVAFAAGAARPALDAAVPASAVHLAPDYATTPSHDIAVIELSADAPVAPVPYRIEPLSEGDVSTALRLVGFGLEALDDPGDDRPRRAAEVELEEVDGVTVRWFSEDAGLCYGDSGGAVYLDGPGGLELVAVATEGDAACAARGSGVRTDAFTTFLANPGAAGPGDDDDFGDDDDDTFDPTTEGCEGCGEQSLGVLLLAPLGLRRRRLR